MEAFQLDPLMLRHFQGDREGPYPISTELLAVLREMNQEGSLSTETCSSLLRTGTWLEFGYQEGSLHLVTTGVEHLEEVLKTPREDLPLLLVSSARGLVGDFKRHWARKKLQEVNCGT